MGKATPQPLYEAFSEFCLRKKTQSYLKHLEFELSLVLPYWSAAQVSSQVETEISAIIKTVQKNKEAMKWMSF